MDQRERKIWARCRAPFRVLSCLLPVLFFLSTLLVARPVRANFLWKLSSDDTMGANTIADCYLPRRPAIQRIAVTGIGDLDGDGVADWAVGYPGEGASSQGVVIVLLMGSDNKVSRCKKFQGNTICNAGSSECPSGGLKFGSSLLSTTNLDPNESNTKWLIVGYESLSNNPGFVALRLRATDDDITVDIEHTINMLDEPNNALTGSSVLLPGDLDSNGIEDIILGSPLLHNEAGGFYVCKMKSWTQTPYIFNKTYNKIGNPGDKCGSTITMIGDVDFDGVQDIAIGCESVHCRLCHTVTLVTMHFVILHGVLLISIAPQAQDITQTEVGW